MWAWGKREWGLCALKLYIGYGASTGGLAEGERGRGELGGDMTPCVHEEAVIRSYGSALSADKRVIGP
jgi:hypothetical protein